MAKSKPRENPRKVHHDQVNEADITLRQNDALKYRRMGMSLRAIAEKLTVSHEQVRKDIDAALQLVIEENKSEADLLRAMEVDHLDQLRIVAANLAGEVLPKRASLKAKQLKLNAIDRLIRISERRSKLLGIDAPDKHIVEHNIPSLTDVMNGTDASDR